MTGPSMTFGYPEGYKDPEWDGSEAEYRDKVVPARSSAIRDHLNAQLAALGFPDLRFEWVTPSVDEP